MKRRLAEAFPAEEFIVYGSVARGEAAPDSDLDLLVITSRPMSHREQYALRAWPAKSTWRTAPTSACSS